MNIFVIDQNPRKSAEGLSDQHLVKMILETAQILDGGTRPIMHNLFPGQGAHQIVKIPRTQLDNPIIRSADCPVVWDWCLRHFDFLLREFIWRYGHPHAYDTTDMMHQLLTRRDEANWCMTRRGFYLAMPEAYKKSEARHVGLTDAVASYQAYYAAEKTRFGKDRAKPSTWTKRLPPDFLIDARDELGEWLMANGNKIHFELREKANA